MASDGGTFSRVYQKSKNYTVEISAGAEKNYRLLLDPDEEYHCCAGVLELEEDTQLLYGPGEPKVVNLDWENK